MSSAAILLLAALGQFSPPEPASSDAAALVRGLGAPRFAERQSAAVELERIGSPALPALRAARQSRDMEVKTRAQALLLKIETALLTQPTSVRFDFDGAPLSEVVQSLSRQTGFKIVLYPQNLPRWKTQRLTLRHPGAVSFWKAVDELCDTASLQYNPSMQGIAGHQDQVFALTEAVVRTMTPISDQGPSAFDFWESITSAGSATCRPAAVTWRRCRPRRVRPLEVFKLAHAVVRRGSIR